MPTLKELLAQKAELDAMIVEIKTEGRAKAISEVRALMEENGLGISDLNDRSRPAQAGARRKVAAKYRNPATGDTWSGRGLKPKWMQAEIANGKRLEDFVIAA